MLSETQSRYSCQLRDMQRILSHYEEELMQLRHDLERQNREYKVLLGIKTHLEKEIATYRQLLDGENEGWGKGGRGGGWKGRQLSCVRSRALRFRSIITREQKGLCWISPKDT